ncbi:hypothetical protein LCGC14_3142750, partial [marine sediment metagenome]
LEKELRIWKTEEYTEKENSKRIEKLEKDAKDHDLYQQDQYDIIKQELSELKNKLKFHSNRLSNEIEELKGEGISLWRKVQTDVDEGKESLKALGGFSNEHAYDIANQEKVLHKLIKHYKENLEYITDKSSMWDFSIEDLDSLLTMLGGEKTVEVLRQDSAVSGKTARSGSTPQTDSKPPSFKEFIDPIEDLVKNIVDWKQQQKEEPDQGVSMGDNIPEGFDIIKEMRKEKEPTDFIDSIEQLYKAMSEKSIPYIPLNKPEKTCTNCGFMAPEEECPCCDIKEEYNNWKPTKTKILEIQKQFRESKCPHETIEYGLCLECGRGIRISFDIKELQDFLD